jgi:N-methylhydantoinase A
VLCAHGDATTRIRDEASQTFIRTFAQTSDAEVASVLERLAATAARSLTAEGIPAGRQEVGVQIDLRYQGQGMRLTLDLSMAEFRAAGLAGIARRFDEMHTQLFTFALDAPHELVNLRAVVQGPEAAASLEPVPRGGSDPQAALIGTTAIHVDGAEHSAKVFDRTKLAAGNRIAGPAIVMQMDTTTLILPGHTGEVDAIGTILIRPSA